MTDEIQQLKNKIKILEDARTKLSRDWLSVEREKTKLSAAIDNLSVGFIILDDYNKITHINSKAEDILSSTNNGELTIENFVKELEGKYDIKNDITNCKQERIQIGPKDV